MGLFTSSKSKRIVMTNFCLNYYGAAFDTVLKVVKKSKVPVEGLERLEGELTHNRRWRNNFIIMGSEDDLKSFIKYGKKYKMFLRVTEDLEEHAYFEREFSNILKKGEVVIRPW